jgi:hypothetical protein
LSIKSLLAFVFVGLLLKGDPHAKRKSKFTRTRSRKAKKLHETIAMQCHHSFALNPNPKHPIMSWLTNSL